jgi:hypothetical protein
LPPSHQNEYLKYINEAKKHTTILIRVAKVMEMLEKVKWVEFLVFTSPLPSGRQGFTRP